MPSASSFEREVRFAVVIYGGVSLAIYINGVAQEMLRLVRSTAVDPATGEFLYPEPVGSARVYRKLASIAGDGKLHVAGTTTDADGMPIVEADGRRRTQFVIDILSGTSAGGINAVFLAKALSNNQSLDQLAQMWIDEADIDVLLNDRHSLTGTPLELDSLPPSLLNGKRMYYKLLGALDGMDLAQRRAMARNNPESRPIPLSQRIDLYSTATDLDGIAVPIALADQEVEERRHRNVFHFQHPSQRQQPADRVELARRDSLSDFTFDINPFLAFAARCTSAFPFAFEPMALCDIGPALKDSELHRGERYCTDPDYWRQFYREYTRDLSRNPGATRFEHRSFGDGGYLDNKPFTYAVETILRRQSAKPVDRKLVYLEPSPETISIPTRRSPEDRPDAIDNSIKALTALPRYETIRQDLEQVLEWNHNIRRLRRLMRELGRRRGSDLPAAESLASRSYRILRLASATDLASNRVAATVQVDPSSARGEAIRALAIAWREQRYPSESEQDEFLRTYDFEYLERAIRYLLASLDDADYEPELRETLADLFNSITALYELDLEEAVGAGTLTPAQTRDLELVVSPKAAAAAGLPASALHATEEALAERIRYVLETRGWQSTIDSLHQALSSLFRPTLDRVRSKLDEIFPRFGGWQAFEAHDTVLLPLVFGTRIGEVDEVEIIRISPRDSEARALTPFIPRDGTPKIRGALFGAFGAFLDKSWRFNDMLWGRLDGAERLITAVLPDSDPETVAVRDALIYEAQLAIAEEWDQTYGTQVAQMSAARPRGEQDAETTGSRR